MLIATWLVAIGIGVVLGLLGGGGSVLTVPTFVYLLGLPTKSAVAMSMPVVGITSVIGAYGHWRAGNIAWRSALPFGLVAMVGAFGGARLAHYLTGAQQLVLLAVVMVSTALSMLRRKGPEATERTDGASSPSALRPSVLVAAAVVGILTGLVGIGGGFLVVPALVLLAQTPMQRAIGTSLVVIAMNAASGLLGYVGQTAIDWTIVAWFSLLSAVGILVGARLSSVVPPAKLRSGFAYMLLALSAFILWQNRTGLS
ncbi:MAG: sulfite exporter TauE/SafE family protein [Gemmatimonadaceae bacterium]|nr:sulfite exporter TauE/SafE family protein [Gemmatimonadaceae bacterium]